MNRGLNGFVTVVVCFIGCAAVGAGLGAAIDGHDALQWGALVGGLIGLLYGMETGILESYDLADGKGWGALLVDLSWSLVNTVFGFVFGNIIYIFFGSPSHADSRHTTWVMFKPRGSSGFGHSVLQTLGTLNLGGAGQHEKMHLLQARIFGPLYLPLFALSYVVTTLLQLLWTATLGWILKVAGARQTAWFTPPSSSAVSGFFGWIYYATPFELWAYASGNP